MVYLRQAKKMYSLGNKVKAYDYLSKAKKLYTKCLKEAQKHGMINVERSVGSSAAVIGFGVAANQGSVKDKYNTKVSKEPQLRGVINYFEDRIAYCKALEMQWKNAAGAVDFAQTVHTLKEERRSEAIKFKERKLAEIEKKKKAAVKSMQKKKKATESFSVEMFY